MPVHADDSIIQLNDDETLLLIAIVNGNIKTLEIETFKKKLERLFKADINIETTPKYVTFEVPLNKHVSNAIEHMKKWIKLQK